ncbi:MAG: hypothetical protein EOR60_09815 [Mesorhizobium sp.]|nr:MAG: hypothetical protein EOR60_09815 [Mesorhizobium sp.]
MSFSSNAGPNTQFGTLVAKMTIGVRKYPISDDARVAILRQVIQYNHLQQRKIANRWLNFLSLDNKITLINPNFIKSVELIGDDVHPMPQYYRSEIYRALDDLDASGISEELKSECEIIVSKMGEEEAMRMVYYARVTYDSGEDEWNILDDGAAATFFGLEAASFAIPQSTFAEIEEEGYYRARFANLKHVAVMEVPSDRYHKLTRNRPITLRRRKMPPSNLNRAKAQRIQADAARED